MKVIICCTRNWYQYLLVNLYSLFTTNKVEKLYLVVEDDNIENIKCLCNEYKVKVEFVNINNLPEYIKPTSPNYNTKYSKLSMCRLYFTKFIKEDKILYLDADTLIMGDLKELWKTDLKDNVLAGVKEPGEWDKHLWTKGLDGNYINSGVLLMNLKAIREEELDESMIYLINKNKYEFPDQDVINLTCRNRIEYISNEYNSSETTGIVGNAKIIHYIRGNKGWIKGTNRSEYWFNKLTELIERGMFMLKIRITGNLTSLRNYETCLNEKKEALTSGVIQAGTILYVNEEMYQYINGANAQRKSFCELIEIEAKKEVKPKKKASDK